MYSIPGIFNDVIGTVMRDIPVIIVLQHCVLEESLRKD
jgi:hypothetical protein